MQFIRRLFVSVHGSVDEVVTRLQNHDALVRSSLRELERRIATAQQSFANLTRTLAKTDAEIERASNDEALWTKRATESGKSGQQDKAIECLKYAHRAKSTATALEKQRIASREQHRKLQSTLSELKNTQRTLALKHSELNAREKAQLVSDSPFNLSVEGTEEMLARWEDTLGGASNEDAVPELETEFERAEERAELEAELNALMAK